MRVSSILRYIGKKRGELISIVGIIATPVVSLIGGVVMVSSLTPEETGTINLAALWPVYLGFIHFGVLTGMARELPLAIGVGDEMRVSRILVTTSNVVWITGGLGALVCLTSAILLGHIHNDWILAGAIAAGSITILSTNATLHVDTALRSTGKFSRYGINQLASNGVNFLTLPLIPLFGVSGTISRLVLVGAAGILIRVNTGLLRIHGKLDIVELRHLMTVGIPLLISGTLFSFLMVADRSVVALLLTRKEVGYFTIAALIANSMQFLPQAISLIMFPKMAAVYGATGDSSALRPYVLRTFILNLCTLIPLSFIGYFLLPIFIKNYFPDYTPGIRAGQIACITCVFWVYIGMGSVFGVINRMKAYLAVLAGSIGVVWIAGIAMIYWGFGIEGVAGARLGATILVCGFTIWYSLFLTRSPHKTKFLNG